MGTLRCHVEAVGCWSNDLFCSILWKLEYQDSINNNNINVTLVYYIICEVIATKIFMAYLAEQALCNNRETIQLGLNFKTKCW